MKHMKLPTNISYKKVWKALVKLGFEPKKRTATHVLFVKPRLAIDDEVRFVTLICHNPIAGGTLLHTIRKTGLTKEEFLVLL